MAATQKTECGSCGESIYFLKNIRTGKVSPIEAEALPGGNCRTDLQHGTFDVLGPREREQARLADPHLCLHLNHFARCPESRSWARHGSRKSTEVATR